MRRSSVFWLIAVLASIPLLGQNTINVSCPSSASAGVTISCTASLSLGGGVSVDSLTFGITVTPVAAAPALNGANLGFTPAISNTSSSGTPNGVAVLANPSPALTGSLTVGTVTIPLPSDAADGHSYSVAFSNASASYNSDLVSLTQGSAATVVITRSALAVTLSNTGANAFNLSISITGDFGQTTDCGSTLSASASCTVTVTFTPTLTGPRTGSLKIAAAGPASPLVVRLFGAGISGPVGPKVSFSRTAMHFGSQGVGGSSGPSAITLTNTGDATLTVTSVTAGGDYSQTNGCGSVAVSGTCTINVTFTPSTTGSRAGVITIVDDATGSPHVIRLFGLGTSGTAPATSFSSASVNFGNQPMGVTSAGKMVTVTNTGSSTLTITAVTAAGDFSASGCVTSLAPSANCTITITFTPTATGLRNGSVALTDNAAGSPQMIRLFGNGT